MDTPKPPQRAEGWDGWVGLHKAYVIEWWASMTSRGAYGKAKPAVPPSTLGARIRQVRVAWGWTQNQLADRLNIDQQMISLWERNKTEPSRTGFALLAQLMNVTKKALVTGEGFSIPDLPQGVSGSAEDQSITIHLPLIQPGEVASISLPGSKANLIRGKEAAQLLRGLIKSGRPVWIVHDGEIID